MTGGMKMMVAATTLNEAVMAATERWRVIVEDPEATLPWSTHFDFFEEPGPGPIADTAAQMICMVTVEFDRKTIDEVTGAVDAAS
jgi:hypothetical protein